MKVKKLTKDEYDSWNVLVDHSLQGSLFSNTWYLDALQVKYSILVVSNSNIIRENSIKAGLVLTKNEINTYSNPMLDKYLGVVFSKEAGSKAKLISKQYKYMELLANELKKIKSFDYYFHPSFENWIPLYWHGFSQQTRYTYRISNFNQTEEEIYTKFHSSVKRGINSSIKNKVTVKQDISFDTLWDITNKTFIRQGGKSPFNKNKLESFTTNLKEKKHFVSFGAYNEKGICIAVCGLVYNKKSSYLLLSGIDIENQVRGANAFILYESMKYFHAKCDYYDFEGSMLQGVEQFYRKFGGDLIPYMRIWNDNLFNYTKTKAKKLYKKIRYGK